MLSWKARGAHHLSDVLSPSVTTRAGFRRSKMSLQGGRFRGFRSLDRSPQVTTWRMLGGFSAGSAQAVCEPCCMSPKLPDYFGPNLRVICGTARLTNRTAFHGQTKTMTVRSWSPRDYARALERSSRCQPHRLLQPRSGGGPGDGRAWAGRSHHLHRLMGTGGAMAGHRRLCDIEGRPAATRPVYGVPLRRGSVVYDRGRPIGRWRLFALPVRRAPAELDADVIRQ